MQRPVKNTSSTSQLIISLGVYFAYSITFALLHGFSLLASLFDSVAYDTQRVAAICIGLALLIPIAYWCGRSFVLSGIYNRFFGIDRSDKKDKSTIIGVSAIMFFSMAIGLVLIYFLVAYPAP